MISASSSSERAAPEARHARGLLRRSVRLFWDAILPASMAAVAMHFLVPVAGVGLAGWVARIGRAAPALVFVILFLAFSLGVRAWRHDSRGASLWTDVPRDIARA